MNKTIVFSVVAGIAAFGALIWGVSMLPNNAITAPVKKVANIASGN